MTINIGEDIEEIPDIPQYTGLVAHIRSQLEIAKREKIEIEKIMIKGKRDFECEYDPAELAVFRAGKSSLSFAPSILQKVRDTEAWIWDIYKGLYSIKPTPIADIPPDIMASIEEKERLQLETALMQFLVGDIPVETIPPENLIEIKTQLDQRPKPPGYQNIYRQKVDESKQNVLKRAQEVAEERASNMKRKIDDQLVEAKFSRTFRDFIHDFSKFPAAFLKKEYKKQPVKKWKSTAGGNWKVKVKEEVILSHRRVSPFNIFPVSNSAELQHTDLIERERYTRAQLNSFIGAGNGFSDKAISSVLNKYDSGLQDQFWTDSEVERINKGQSGLNQGQLIDTAIYNGYVQGKKILEWAEENNSKNKEFKKVTSPDLDYLVEAWLVGSDVIKLNINQDPMGRKPYFKASFESIPDQFWGRSPAQMGKNLADTMNDTHRAGVNNLALASGPISEFDIDRIQNGDKITSIVAGMVIHSDNKKLDNMPAVRFHQAPLITPQINAVFDHYKRILDNITIPPFAHGDTNISGAGSTSSGLNKLIDLSDRVLRWAIADIDEVVSDVITDYYDHNMEFSDDESIKGDIRIEAGGAKALAEMGQSAQRKLEFLNILQPYLPLMADETGVPVGAIDPLKSAGKQFGMDVEGMFPMYGKGAPKLFTPQGVNPQFPGVQSTAPKPGLKNLLPDGSPAGGVAANQFQNRQGMNTRLA